MQEQIRTLLLQVDDVIAQDNAAKKEGVEFTADLLSEISEELNKSLESVPEPKIKEEKQAIIVLYNVFTAINYAVFSYNAPLILSQTYFYFHLLSF